MSSLKVTAKKSLLWSFIDNVLLKGITFLVTIVLARILDPKDFGLVGIITVFIALGNAIVEGGMGNSIIRDKYADAGDYTSVFYGNLLISVLIYPILYLTAPLIAGYFDNQLLINLIRVYSISFIFSAFFFIQHSVLVRQMSFKQITIYNMPAIIIGSIIGLVTAYLGYGVWSLIFMQLSILFFKAVFYWFFSEWKPTIGFSIEKLKKHFNFGYKLMISSFLDASMREVYSFIIGKNFSLSTLGYFNHSKTFRNYPVNLITVVVSSVTYPLLSGIQENKEKVASLYGTILRSLFFIISPVMLCLILISKPLFIILFTEKWLPAVPYFQLLAVSGILTPIHAFNINIFKIYNRTDLFLKLEVIKIIIVFSSLAVGLFYGIYGLLFSIIISSFLALFVNTFYSGKLINYKTSDQLKDMLPVFLIGFISVGFSSFLLNNLSSLNNIIQLIFIGSVFVITYLGLSYLFNRKTLNVVIILLLNVLSKKKV